MDTATFLDHIQEQHWYRGQIVHTESLPLRNARYADLERPLHTKLEAILKNQDLLPLYVHQANAINALRGGADVVISTPAASGKSLCYHIPVLQAILEDRSARALYLYPTKALAQDQLRKLDELVQGLEPAPKYTTYDGDTRAQDRGSIRRSAQMVLTNPDMLHLGILPNKHMWRSFLSRLRYVVLDESHVYRGVFGSHVASVIRRLRRVCELYGASPQFILSSATIANPGDHAERLAGVQFKVVDDNGAPFGGKDFLMWNPPLLDEEKTARRSPNTDATFAFSELLKQGIRTITFCRTRKVAELVYVYVRDRLSEESSSLANRLRPYRAGYLSETRREIEQGLFDGSLLGVSSTNALELGIDIGDLEATILTGYPGTIASAWQQAGRSGRSDGRSLSILIASDNPLDQYLMRHPDAFFGKPLENALISPANPYVLKPHLLCAAYDLPLTAADQAHFGEEMWPLINDLVREGKLRETRHRWYPSSSVEYPAEDVSIRSTTPAFFQVVAEGSGSLLETVDAAAAFHQLHPGAVYLHQGEAFIVTKLDIESRTAWTQAHTEPFYTVARDHTEISVVKLASKQTVNGTGVYLGQVDVSNTVVGFKKKRQFTEEVIHDEPLTMPTSSFSTVAVWWDIPERAIELIARTKMDLSGGLHAAEHAAISMLPFFAMCDRIDIGGVSTECHPDTGKPQVFIYDGHPGGMGISEKGYELILKLWDTTLKTIQECPCKTGCPSCIQSPKCGNNNSPLDKQAAELLLEQLLLS